MPPHAPDEGFTIRDAQQLASILLPMIRDELRPEFDRVSAVMKDNQSSANQQRDELSSRVAALEKVWWKVSGAIGVGLFLADAAIQYLLKKMTAESQKLSFLGAQLETIAEAVYEGELQAVPTNLMMVIADVQRLIDERRLVKARAIETGIDEFPLP